MKGLIYSTTVSDDSRFCSECVAETLRLHVGREQILRTVGEEIKSGWDQTVH